ncbi:MAG: CopG family transcriptional regulator [bacterium (Candidatus Ratteibacteria) CG01_land_8_20_14_3_00_40_19]|uniref:CopG family transcriptional regulator n=1 Tax=bacterium (Candidatus Ratteibacteria) CG01_land_8_20_14_3_00_40_19 TaxID=2014290 RepID=A0A2M7E7B6_9BACT|nr:MAG: CopG family transcriptional regulator [bacterium (Candidatus Ratteibacteria) CG01_land_8_20_14_3_00_40_19]HCG76639.1 CopG family transcriptional regulator [bacterium]
MRLSDEEYEKIAATAKVEHRPISNFITTATLREIEESYYVDVIEMDQIKSDKKLLKKLKTGHRDAKKMEGRLVG